MATASEVTVQFRIVCGAELPKTDLLSSIDPYVKVYFDGLDLGETKHFNKDPEPTWEEDFFFDARRDEEGYLSGIVRLELFDENRAKQDEYVGCVEIDLNEVPPEAVDPTGQQQIEFFDYPISYRNDKRGEKFAKQGRASRLTVAFLGAIPSWSALAAQLEGCEEAVGLLADEESKQLYVPLPDGEGAGLYGGIQYCLPRAVHFKLVTTSKNYAGLHLDFRCSKSRSLRVSRTQHHAKRLRLLSGLRVYGEATLTNLPLSTDLRKLHLAATPRRAATSVNVAEALHRAGFGGPGSGAAGSFKKAIKEMGEGGALLDEEASGVFVPVGKPPHSALLQLDYSGAGVGGGGGGGSGGERPRSAFAALLGGGGGGAVVPALRVVSVKGPSKAQGKTLVHELATTHCETTETVSETHRRAVPVLGGEYEVTRSVELPGALNEDDNPDVYDSAVLVYYALEAEPIASCRFMDLFEPPPEPEPESPSIFAVDPLDPDIPHSMGSVMYNVAAHGGKMMGKVVGQIGSLVGTGSSNKDRSVGSGGAGGGSGGLDSDGGGGGGVQERVMGVIRAPLKLFRGRQQQQPPPAAPAPAARADQSTRSKGRAETVEEEEEEDEEDY